MPSPSLQLAATALQEKVQLRIREQVLVVERRDRRAREAAQVLPLGLLEEGEQLRGLVPATLLVVPAAAADTIFVLSRFSHSRVQIT